ncbi:hypothetical protein QL285_029660 [Trifolium repens]|nr:hypothetical protein QL285_029660 [Trifolium repens]
MHNLISKFVINPNFKFQVCIIFEMQIQNQIPQSPMNQNMKMKHLLIQSVISKQWSNQLLINQNHNPHLISLKQVVFLSI